MDNRSSSSTQNRSKSRPRPPSLRLDHVGVDPSVIIGKILTRVRRSQHHPALTLEFSDGSTYQILVDGYDPVYRGTPKFLQNTHAMLPPSSRGPEYYILNPPEEEPLEMMVEVLDCAYVRLSDKAFKREDKLTREMEEDTRGRRRNVEPVQQQFHESKWDQNHLAVAFKFKILPLQDEAYPDSDEIEEYPVVKPKWNIVWATMEEYTSDELTGATECTFRSYDDVYIHHLDRTRSSSPAKGAFSGSHWNNSSLAGRKHSRSRSPAKVTSGEAYGWSIPKRNRTDSNSSGTSNQSTSPCPWTVSGSPTKPGWLSGSGPEAAPTPRKAPGSPTKSNFGFGKVNNSSQFGRHRRNNSSRSTNSEGMWLHDMAPTLEDHNE